MTRGPINITDYRSINVENLWINDNSLRFRYQILKKMTKINFLFNSMKTISYFLNLVLSLINFPKLFII